MKRFSFFPRLVICSGVFFLFGSFTTIFENTPFMKGVLDNQSASLEHIAEVKIPAIHPEGYLNDAEVGKLISHWKSVFITDLKKAELEKESKENLMMVRQAEIIRILNECKVGLAQIKVESQSRKSAQQLQETQEKLAGAIQLLYQMGESKSNSSDTQK